MLLHYKLELEITSPNIVTVDEQYEIIYTIINNGDDNFPGGKILLRLAWSDIGNDTVVNHPLVIEPLPPDSIFEFSFLQTDRIPGMTYITFLEAKETFRQNIHFNIHAKNGNMIPPNQVIHSLRVRSMEEVLQKEMIKTLEENIDSQKRLERTQNNLTLVGVVIALLQLIGMFVVPYLQANG